MAGVYQFMANLNNQLSRARKADTLTKGKAYICTKFERKLSLYKGSNNADVYNIIAHYKDSGLLFNSYLPKKFNDMTEGHVEALNEDCKKGRNPKLVFYGKIGSARELDIIPHDQGICLNCSHCLFYILSE